MEAPGNNAAKRLCRWRLVGLHTTFFFRNLKTVSHTCSQKTSSFHLPSWRVIYFSPFPSLIQCSVSTSKCQARSFTPAKQGEENHQGLCSLDVKSQKTGFGNQRSLDLPLMPKSPLKHQLPQPLIKYLASDHLRQFGTAFRL